MYRCSEQEQVSPWVPKRWRRPHWRMLCYHAVPAVRVDGLRRQLLAFRAAGFVFVTLEEGLRGCTAGFAAPTLTLTFDDGDRSLHAHVLPLLEELRICALAYITSDYVRRGWTYRDEPPAPALSPAQLRDWVSAGHGVGSHTATHAPLPLCSDARLHRELRESRDVLEQWVQVPVRHLAYPWGQHSAHTREFLQESGIYRSAATIDRGMMRAGHDPWGLRRDVGTPAMPPAQLIRKMRWADRWYWLRRLRPRPPGYWERHPEETWTEPEVQPA